MPAKKRKAVGKRKCPRCGGWKDHYAIVCQKCKRPEEWATPAKGLKGPAHPAWRGGEMVDRDGYIRLYRPDHPWPRRGGYILAHVALIELEIGRRIRSDENVHHIDGDRQNNDRSNLELVKKGAHSSHHRKLDTAKRKRDAAGRFAPD